MHLGRRDVAPESLPTPEPLDPRPAPCETWPSGPIVPLASVSSNSTPASTHAHSTRCVQIEVGRPQIRIMVTISYAGR